MDLAVILSQINNFRVHSEIKDYNISDFFDAVMEKIDKLKKLNHSEKEQLLDTLFAFLNNHNPELEEDFSFIHLIESIDKPNYTIYSKKLLENNIKRPSLTSVLLLNRYINSLHGKAWGKAVVVVRKVVENIKKTTFMTEDTLNYCEYQIK
ncbi:MULTISPECIES: hypothetical protein [Flavobacterium]|uniref:Immunity protein 30 n=1 Tax=Flavobacterium jumunjinense TaxID=998845 RepID=A0ABV5GQ85_9FLAO|nr:MULTISPECIES: hypothetical protein [Flavobacterium]